MTSKRWSWIVAAVLLLVSVLAGCAAGTDKEPGKTPAEIPSVSVPEETSSSAEVPTETTATPPPPPVEVPTVVTPPPVQVAPPQPPAPAPYTPPPAPPQQTQAPSAYYANCAAARAAGAAPLHVGDPGYRPALDRDGDGVACE